MVAGTRRALASIFTLCTLNPLVKVDLFLFCSTFYTRVQQTSVDCRLPASFVSNTTSNKRSGGTLQLNIVCGAATNYSNATSETIGALSIPLNNFTSNVNCSNGSAISRCYCTDLMQNSTRTVSTCDGTSVSLVDGIPLCTAYAGFSKRGITIPVSGVYNPIAAKAICYTVKGSDH